MEALAAGHPGTDNPQIGIAAEAVPQPWGDISASGAPQLGQFDVSQLALLQQPQQAPTMQFTADQLAALTGALGGNPDLSALTGALNANPELLQRLMVAPAELQQSEQPAMNIELPRAPDLVSTSFMLEGNAAVDAQDPVAASSAPDALQQAGLVLPDGTTLNASMPQLQQQPGAMVAGDGAPMTGAEPTQDAVAAAVAAAAAAGGAAGLPEDLQLQLQRGVKRRAGDAGEPQADSDVADILLAMAGNPALKKLAQQQAELAAAAATGGLPVGDAQLAAQGTAVDGDAAITHAIDAAAQLQASVSASDAAAAAAAGDMQTAMIIDQNGQQVTVSMGASGLTDAAGNPYAGIDFSALAASGALSAVSGGFPGLSLDMQSLGSAGMLQLAGLSQLQGLQAGGAQGYAALPGMLQLVQLPMQGDLSALQQTGAFGAAAGTDEDGRPLKRAREDGGSDDGAAAAEGDAMAAGLGDGTAAALEAAAAAGGVPGLEGMDLQQAADASAAAQAAAAIGTVVNVNGVNMLIPAAPQLQLQLAAGDGNMQDQLLALQQQVQLAQLPLMGGLGGVQLNTAGINLATATPDQLQNYLQTQQQIQQLQIQHQLSLVQLQLGQQGLMLAGGGGRLLGLDTDASGHMVRRHGVLPERLVTREMLKQVFHLPIEEAAKHLGIGQTMLKHYCRKFGIPRWPYRKRQSVVQLISSIENYATDKPQIVEPALNKLRSFLAQIDEDPNIDLDGPIKRLRQAFFKEAYKARVRKQQHDSGEDRRGGRPGGGRSEAWLENLCQAIVDSPGGQPGQVVVGGLDMHGDDGDDMTGDAGADELAAAIHHHAQQQAVQGHLQHQGLDPNALAMVAAAAQLGGVGGLGQEGLAAAAGLDDPALVAAAAAAAAQAQAQQEQLAALQAAVEQQQQQQE